MWESSVQGKSGRGGGGVTYAAFNSGGESPERGNYPSKREGKREKRLGETQQQEKL